MCNWKIIYVGLITGKAQEENDDSDDEDDDGEDDADGTGI